MKKFLLCASITLVVLLVGFMAYRPTLMRQQAVQKKADAEFNAKQKAEITKANEAVKEAEDIQSEIEMSFSEQVVSIRNNTTVTLTNCQVYYDTYSGRISGTIIEPTQTVNINRAFIELTNHEGKEYLGALNESPDGKVSLMCDQGGVKKYKRLEYSL